MDTNQHTKWEKCIAVQALLEHIKTSLIGLHDQVGICFSMLIGHLTWDKLCMNTMIQAYKVRFPIAFRQKTIIFGEPNLSNHFVLSRQTLQKIHDGKTRYGCLFPSNNSQPDCAWVPRRKQCVADWGLGSAGQKLLSATTCPAAAHYEGPHTKGEPADQRNGKQMCVTQIC